MASLREVGIPVTYCPDVSALPHLPQLQHEGEWPARVLLGAEAVFSNGAVYARAGTGDVALAARELGMPVSALCEMINCTERMANDSLTYNEIDPDLCGDDGFRLLFDTTRGEFVDRVITEFGPSTPGAVSCIIRKLEDL
jgi:translation initiation factor eIF-2B subunit delta